MGLHELYEVLGGLRLTALEVASVIEAAHRHVASIETPDDEDIPDNDWIAAQARANYAAHSDDDIKIDDEPVISRGGNGAFVMAWVWVPYPSRDEDY